MKSLGARAARLLVILSFSEESLFLVAELSQSKYFRFPRPIFFRSRTDFEINSAGFHLIIVTEFFDLDPDKRCKMSAEAHLKSFFQDLVGVFPVFVLVVSLDFSFFVIFV